MERGLVNTGISVIGDVPRNTQVCLFYQTKNDLLNVLVPYFKTGLENNEFCLWVISEPLDNKVAIESMRKSVTDFNSYLEKGQIEIIPHNEWYLPESKFDPSKVNKRYKGKLNKALASGYDGMRATGIISQLDKNLQKKLPAYETAAPDNTGKILTIFTCSINGCKANEIIDAVSNHHLTLIIRSGKWDTIGKYQNGFHEPVLDKRLKELRCLYEISNIAGAPDITLYKRYHQIVNMLPSAWQYPGIACARISINNREFKTENYRQTDYRQSADIIVNGARAGMVEVSYLEAMPELDEGPFSKAERLLLEAVAERLGIITEHREIEEALRKSQELFKTVSHDSPLGIYIIQDEKLQYTNPQFQKLTGYSEKELRKRDLLSLVVPGDIDVVKSSTVFTLKEESPYPCEYRIYNKAGRIRWVMQTISTIHYKGRDAILGNLMDITERKYLERKVIEYEELSKMKTDLLATISHELRTPLATIKGYSTMLIDYFSRLSSGEIKDYLKSIDSSTDSLTKLVDNLLETSRMEAGLLKLEKAPTGIIKLIRQVVTEARIRTNQHHIVLTLEKRLPKVNIDTKRIRQVLDNLINNAVKYSPQGTEILVSARQAGQELVISVADRGMGIPAEELTNVFDRMYRIEQRLTSGANGVGLGLYICRSLVVAHGGQIWAESKKGEGSTFHFTLPLANKVKRTKS